MKNARFTTERIIAILQEHAVGAASTDLMRRHNVSRKTFYARGDLPISDAKRLRAREDENVRLKRLSSPTKRSTRRF